MKRDERFPALGMGPARSRLRNLGRLLLLGSLFTTALATLAAGLLLFATCACKGVR
jgi:hypothetical protein